MEHQELNINRENQSWQQLMELGNRGDTGLGDLIQKWRSQLMKKDVLSEEHQKLTMTIKIYLSKTTIGDKELSQLSFQELEGLSQQLGNTDNAETILTICFKQEEIYHCELMSKSEKLFKAIIKSFPTIESDEIRQSTMWLILKLVEKNLELAKMLDQPYYFLEYLLYRLNQGDGEDQSLHLFEALARVYQSPHHDNLLTESDFKVAVDVLVRLMENSSKEQILVRSLELYLILSISERMRSGNSYYRLQQVLQVVQEQDKSQALIQLYEQLSKLASLS